MSSEERTSIEAHARELGVPTPFAGPWLRQNWGRCVFWDEGCRLHATFSAQAKPTVCRQFPFVSGRTGLAIDPSCFHPDAHPDGQAPAVSIATQAAPTAPLDRGLWRDLAQAHEVRALLDALPLAAVTAGPRLGPQTREQLLKLVEPCPPRVPTDPECHALHRRSQTVMSHGLVPRSDVLPTLLVGGGQLLLGAGLAVDSGFAAWLRLLRTGVL